MARWRSRTSTGGRCAQSSSANAGLNCGLNRRLRFLQLSFVLVFLARPEESAKTVAFSARHDVNVKMQDALAHAIVDCDEAALGAHGSLDRFGQHLRVAEERF